jgi:hypothetical protein
MTAEQQFRRWYRKSQQVSPVRPWGLKKGAEVGVARGTFTRHLFDHISGLHMTGVDPWLRMDGEEESIADHELRGKNWVKMKMKSEEAAPQIADKSLDFVYIDGDHTFDAVMLDLILWSRKVREGGLVCGHDYYRFRNAGVVPAVDCYTREHNIHEWFITDEKLASFFWVKHV